MIDWLSLLAGLVLGAAGAGRIFFMRGWYAGLRVGHVRGRSGERAAERKACADLVEHLPDHGEYGARKHYRFAADAIRARGARESGS